MKIKAVAIKQSLLLFLILALPLLALLGCSSKQELISKQELEELRTNPYFVFYEKQSPEFQKLLARSPFYLLRGTNDVFLENLSRPTTAQGFFKSLPHPMIHGDFHADQMAKIETIDTLEDLDTADYAPFWLDLVRQEMSAQLLARELSLKTYTPGSCVKHYIRTLEVPSGSIAPAGGPFFRGSHSPTPIKEKSEVFTPSPWLSGMELATDSPIRSALETEWHKLFPENPLLELKRIRTGVGSFHSTNYMGKGDKNLYVEFKELNENPLKMFRGAHKAGAMSPCNRFLLAGKIFKPAFKLNCVQAGKKYFMVNPYREAYLPPSLSKIGHSQDLIAHESWMCRKLAQSHQKTWTPSDIKMLTRTWNSNPLLGERILMQARTQSELVSAAYRMILNTIESKN